MAKGEINVMIEEAISLILIRSWLFVFSRRVRSAVVVNPSVFLGALGVLGGSFCLYWASHDLPVPSLNL
jgi:hypothetical protein